MKTFLISGFLLLAGLLNGATIDCTPVNNNVVTNQVLTPVTAYACPLYSAPAGNVIVSVSLDLFVSFQDTEVGSTHQLAATSSELSAQIGGFLPVTSVILTGANDYISFAATTGYFGGSFAPGSGAVASLPGLSAFTVMVTSAPVFPNLVLPDNASVSVAYTTLERKLELQGVPEPTTFGMIGLGLLGLGVLKRKCQTRPISRAT